METLQQILNDQDYNYTIINPDRIVLQHRFKKITIDHVDNKYEVESSIWADDEAWDDFTSHTFDNSKEVIKFIENFFYG